MVELNGLNGGLRNAAKLLNEVLLVFKAFWAGVIRLYRALEEVTHALFDILVEPLRASPYFWGHIVGFYLIWKVVEHYLL